jgi:hypothetical protein
MKKPLKDMARAQMQEVEPEKPRLIRPFLLDDNEFGRELTEKCAERFYKSAGVKEVIEMEPGYMNMFRRLALTTTIYYDSQLRSADLWPVTPSQSEVLLQIGLLPQPQNYWESLALVLYRRCRFDNTKESREITENIKQYRSHLGLNESDLEKSLFIVNAGLETDSNMKYGVKPVVLPGLTQIYVPPAINSDDITEECRWTFNYADEIGMPLHPNSKGKRELRLASSPGLNCLRRLKDLNLVIDCDLQGLLAGQEGGITFHIREE